MGTNISLKTIPSTISNSNLKLQQEILPKVSRTFALTIPQLPEKLQIMVANAYLLCRIADTLEDTTELDTTQKEQFLEDFTLIVKGRKPAKHLIEVAKYLTDNVTPIAEKQLILQADKIIAITHSLQLQERNAIATCIERMCAGMHKFEQQASIAGLNSLRDLDCYCYFVAGVVGQMLTELFCSYCPEINKRKAELSWLGVSFGQGLQMTNILKDFWEDRKRGVSWLPRDIFTKHGINLAELQSDNIQPDFGSAYAELIAIAHAHLKNALSYTLIIPKQEQGIRKFCLWAIWFAIYTLRNMQNKPLFTSGQEVKIKRSLVRALILKTNVLSKWDIGLTRAFNMATEKLPFQALAADWEPELFLQYVDSLK